MSLDHDSEVLKTCWSIDSDEDDQLLYIYTYARAACRGIGTSYTLFLMAAKRQVTIKRWRRSLCARAV